MVLHYHSMCHPSLSNSYAKFGKVGRLVLLFFLALEPGFLVLGQVGAL